MLGKRYILRNMGHWDSLQPLQTILEKITTHQKEEIFLLLPQEGLAIKIPLKMKIYKINNIQKVLTPLMAKYKKLLK
tara:strand:- start:913 stop:1143 length:231 start_codon:yes stop_codon:yes gene_type:complete